MSELSKEQKSALKEIEALMKQSKELITQATKIADKHDVVFYYSSPVPTGDQGCATFIPKKQVREYLMDVLGCEDDPDDPEGEENYEREFVDDVLDTMKRRKSTWLASSDLCS